ncbi:Asp-tRNA(Asn)/Glu-tRNA(Gln) amidotransferase subunit GatA [Patescibacteria group bacterium]|nr:Asp-tRNA(Asn)/Glu-tRNA(Gln) amidotransferase subunit GatA [Patescibacteria group bacterium]
MKINLSQLTIKDAHELIQSQEMPARELLSLYLDNIKKHDGDINAFLEVFDDSYEQAESVDKRVKAGQSVELLAGIPVGVKDNILIEGKTCSAGSKILENFVAPYSATAIEKLKRNRAVFVGRTNMDEFAMGSSTENSAYKVTKNPYDTERVAGGSSGGSVAAVAQQECFAALGSETGGSVRQPASFCGVVGLKPTYGAVSRYGLMALASSLDQIGLTAKTTEDVEIVFDAIRGVDPLDSTTVDSSKIHNSEFKIQNLKIGVPKEFFLLSGDNNAVSDSVAKSVNDSIELFKSLGFKIKEVSIPSLKYAVETYYIIMPAEASSNLARYDGVKYGFYKNGSGIIGDYMNTREAGFGDEPKTRIILGTYVLSAGYYDAYYKRAVQVKNLIKKDFENAFKEVDVLLSPTTPSPAFKVGEKTDSPTEMYLSDIFTCSANLAGVPAMSIPCGFDKSGNKKLPLGLQLTTPWFEEKKLFHLGKLFEDNF